MRTIDPYFAPGLWGSAPMPPQSSLMAGHGSPPGSWQRPAVIANSSLANSLSAKSSISHAPLASLAGSVLGPRFHAWYGRSGRRTICSVYPVLENNTGRGLPDFAWAIVIAAGLKHGRLHCVGVFAFGEEGKKSAEVDRAVADGAIEWHVHLLAQDETARRAVLRDLESV